MNETGEVVPPILSETAIEDFRNWNDGGPGWAAISEVIASHEALRAALTETRRERDDARGDATAWEQRAVDAMCDLTALRREHDALKADYGQMQEWYTAYRRENPRG